MYRHPDPAYDYYLWEKDHPEPPEMEQVGVAYWLFSCPEHGDKLRVDDVEQVGDAWHCCQCLDDEIVLEAEPHDYDFEEYKQSLEH